MYYSSLKGLEILHSDVMILLLLVIAFLSYSQKKKKENNHYSSLLRSMEGMFSFIFGLCLFGRWSTVQNAMVEETILF